MQMYADIYLN